MTVHNDSDRSGGANAPPEWPAGPNEVAYEAAVAGWDGAPPPLVTLGRTLAGQLDGQPQSAPLARAYHRVLDDLESRTFDGGDGLVAALAELRSFTPDGHTSSDVVE